MPSPHPVHHHEEPPSPDARSLNSERQSEKDAKDKRSLVTISTTSIVPTIAGQGKDGEVQVPKATTKPPTSKPIPEKPTTSGPIKGVDNVDSPHHQGHRRHGSVVTTGNNLDDSAAECWVAISRASSPQNHDDRLTSLDNGEFYFSDAVFVRRLIDDLQKRTKHPVPLQKVFETA